MLSTGEAAGESEVLLQPPREGDMAPGIKDAVEKCKTKELNERVAIINLTFKRSHK